MPLLVKTQRSQEWHAARRGLITASLAGAILGVDPYKGPLAAFNEITGEPKEHDSQAMRWGREAEEHARAAFEVRTGLLVQETGLWIHPTLPWLGGSPDGTIEDDSLLEIKAPKSLPGCCPPHHLVQIIVNMLCTERHVGYYFAWTYQQDFMERFDRSESAERDILKRLTDWHAAHILTGIPPARRRKATITSDGEIRS